jgi:hypothetical protein
MATAPRRTAQGTETPMATLAVVVRPSEVVVVAASEEASSEASSEASVGLEGALPVPVALSVLGDEVGSVAEVVEARVEVERVTLVDVAWVSFAPVWPGLTM